MYMYPFVNRMNRMSSRIVFVNEIDKKNGKAAKGETKVRFYEMKTI